MLLAVLLLGQLVLLTTRPSAEGSRLEAMIFGALAPIVRATDGGTDALAGAFARSHDLARVRAENVALRAALDAANGELVRLEGIDEELRSLARIAGAVRRENETAFSIADVVYLDPRSRLRTLMLHTSAATPSINQPVRTPEGLIGRVVRTAGRYAKVQLITDPASSVSAMVERSRRQGLVGGVERADGAALMLDLVPNQADVRIGDRVVTGGLDGIFPRGIPIGRVIAIAPGPDMFQRIEVTPYVDYGQLDQVYVLEARSIPERLRDDDAGYAEAGALPARSADAAAVGDADNDASDPDAAPGP